MPGADMLPAPGAGVSALLAHAVGGVLADGEGTPRLRWRLAGEGYDDARMVAGRIVGIGEGVELRFSLPGEQVDLLLLEPAALPGRYRVTGIAFRGEAVARPHSRLVSAIDDATATHDGSGLVVESRFDRPALELDVRGLAAPGSDGDALELVVRREADPAAASPTSAVLDDVRAGQAAIGRLGREVAAFSDRMSALSGMPSALADLQARSEAATQRLAGMLAAQDRALAAIAERLAAAADVAVREGDAGARQADARHAASMQAIDELRAQLDRVSHAVENVFWRRWLRRLRGVAR